MIEVFLLFCFVAILSAVVSAVRGIAMLLGVLWKRLSLRHRVNIR
jgi:predicted membrane metal-binding protein